MGSAWIKIFVLTLSECIAPPGKTVCQENEFELEFLTRADCETALEQLIVLKDESANVIVNKSRSGCRPSAREQTVYASPDEVSGTLGNADDWLEPAAVTPAENDFRKSYEERLESLKTCDETQGVTPCRIGEIIIEGATGEPVEVWRSME
jgi:hypothetical protein